MRKLIVALLLVLCGPALAQVSMTGAGLAKPTAAASYSGPGNIVTGATAWGSCARAYTAAYANGSNSLCDLVDSAAPTTVICTLRVLTTGFVDLAGAYCTGSLTPSAKCAAATGGVCNIQKVYDQTGNGNHWTNSTASSQPRLSFSALGGLPGMLFTSAASKNLQNVNTVTLTQPFSASVVGNRTSNFTTKQVFLAASTGSAYEFGFDATTGTAILNVAGLSITAAASNTTFHAMQGISNGASSNLYIDGSNTSGTNDPANISNTIRIARGNSCCSLDGTVMEVGLWSSKAFSVTGGGDADLLNANQHSSAYGYNF